MIPDVASLTITGRSGQVNSRERQARGEVGLATDKRRDVMDQSDHDCSCTQYITVGIDETALDGTIACELTLDYHSMTSRLGRQANTT